LPIAGKAVKVKLNRALDLGPYPLQEQHRTAARVIRENTAFARDFVHAGAGDPVYTPHLVFSVPQSNRTPEVPCEVTFPLSRQDLTIRAPGLWLQGPCKGFTLHCQL
jgi:hypothetical protein